MKGTDTEGGSDVEIEMVTERPGVQRCEGQTRRKAGIQARSRARARAYVQCSNVSLRLTGIAAH